jgi:asparagine synthase (glutamine-hydrolysing)
MCGISGYLTSGAVPPRGTLERMADALRHRGPDDRGYFEDPEVGLGLAHNRLSILDLTAAGHQPMIGRDGRVVLVYNGELYNFKELRRELEAAGHVFHSRCDTEVILRAYEEWGEDCVTRFCGMFALAIWDADKREILLARDPLGMKPLYYTTGIEGCPGFFFSSELKAFRAIPGFRPRMERGALTSFMEFGYVFDTHRTAFRDVFKMPPGHFLRVQAGGRVEAPRPYYAAPSRPDPVPEAEMPARRAELFEILDTVVAQHLVADVPVGVLLSGGLDSSLIAALASRHAALTTCCMGFEGAAFDERPFARRMAGHIGSTHHEITITPAEVREHLMETIPVFDDLFDDWGTVSTRLLYKKCREMGIKVALVGEGSDELFGGYPVFPAALVGRGPALWRGLRLWHYYGNRRYGRTFVPYFDLLRGFLRESGGDWFHSVRLFEIRRQLPNQYEMKVDKASMSVSVEARAPFLDRRIADLACRLPASVLLRGAHKKVVLREIAAEQGLLPPEILERIKFGGSIAMTWMDDDPAFRAHAREVVLGPAAEWTDRLGLRRAMTDYFDRGRQGYAFPHPLSLFRILAWRLMQLELWSRACGMERP